MGTDFYDPDLLGAAKARATRTGLGTGTGTDDVPSSALSGAAQHRLTREREDRAGQMATAVRELELLRMRHQELEKEKTKLESLTKKQETYERAKDEVVEKLNRGILLVEKEQAQATRMVELYLETSSLFKRMLAELVQMNEESWPATSFETELDKAALVVENAKGDYLKALAKIDAASWHKEIRQPPVEGEGQGEETEAAAGSAKDFSYWLRVGFAISLPLAIVIAVLLSLFLVIAHGLKT